MECNIQNVNFYYEVYGEGTPIVMIHGWGPDHRMMTGCMEPVFQSVDKGWKRIYFDLPGMGKTKGEPWITTSDHIVELVLGLIETIIPNERFVLAGDSYGGYLARGVLQKRPSLVEGLLLICPAGVEVNRVNYKVFEKDELLINSLTDQERAFFQAEGINVIQNRRVWERYREEVLPGLLSVDNAFLNNLDGKISYDVDALDGPFLKPTLILTGRQDSLVGYEGIWKILELYPRASYLLLDKAGHALQIEQDVLFTAAVKEWLERVSEEMSHDDCCRSK